MKCLFTVLFISAAALSLSAQPLANAKDQANHLEVSAGGSFGKAKILPGAEKLAIAQTVVTYKLASTKEVTKSDKKKIAFSGAGSTRYTAAVTSYLEITDGALSNDDYQGITNYFYNYQKTLKENNIDTVAWSKITATDFYKSGKED